MPTKPQTPAKTKAAAKVKQVLQDVGILPDPLSTGPTPKPPVSTDALPTNPVNQQTNPGRCAGCSKPVYAHGDECVVLKARAGEAADDGPSRVYRSVLGAFAILLDSQNKQVKYIALTSGPLTIAEMPLSTFTNSWAPIEGYPVKRAAKLLIGYSQDLGAYKDALDALERLTNLQPLEREQAIMKTESATATKAKTTKPAAAKAAAKAETPKNGKSAKDIKKDVKASTKEKTREPTAASRFRELIKEGGKTCKHSDDEIFAMVKKQFNLDDSKRSYVAWYRNDLKKRGETVPEPKAPAAKA